MSQAYPRRSPSAIKGRWATVRADLIRLAVLVVCLLAFVMAVRRWGDQLWEVIDGPRTVQELTAREGSREHEGDR
jgi:hypothetical protein